MKRKGLVILLAVLILMGAGIFGGIRYFQNTYVVVSDTVYPNDVTELDLSGTEKPDVEKLCGLTELKRLNLRDTKLTVAQYEKLKKALPACEIAWQVPFQGKYLEPDVKELTITSLNQGELESLVYLPELKTVHAEGCADLDMLMELRSRYPDVQVNYRVPIGGRQIASGTTVLMVNNPDVKELSRMLLYLPELEKLTLNGKISDKHGVLELQEAYPHIPIVWNVDIQGRSFVNTSREIDLSGLQLDSVAPVENVLKYLPNLEKIIMCNCGLSSETLDAFWKRHPEIRVVWSVKVSFFTVRTDATTLMPFKYGCGGMTDKDTTEMKYLVDLICLDMGHMGISDLSFLNYMPNMQYLIIADNEVTDITPVASLKKLKYFEMFLNKVTDISPLAQCTALEDVNLCFNPFKDISPLLELEHLQHIWLKGVSLTWSQKKLLTESFPEAKIVTGFSPVSSTDAGWRQIPGYYEQRDLLGMWYMR